METLIFLACVALGLGLFKLIRPLLPLEADDIRTSARYRPTLIHRKPKS